MRSSLTRRTSAKPFSPVPSITYAPTVPAGLGWDTTNVPIVGKVTESLGTMRSYANLTISATSLFDACSTARTAPANTYYVSGSGADTNSGLTSALPVQHIWKAVQLANATGQPAKIVILPAVYVRTFNLWYGGGTAVIPTVDLAIVAQSTGGTGGRVVIGTHDAPGTVVRDGTYTNCQTWAVTTGTVNRLVDTVEKTRFGLHTELVNVSTAALCNSTPNSWALVSGTIYVNRRDQATCSVYNTRLYRSATGNIVLTSPVNLYLENIDFEGGTSNGIIDTSIAAGTTGRYALIANNCTFRYGGGIVDTGGRCMAVDSWPGIAAFFNCDASGGWTDNWNFHNAHSNTMYALTVNCSGADAGRPGSQSCNNWTSHETCIGIDIAGRYYVGRGGSIRSINASKTLFTGTVVEDDFGDIDLSNGSGLMRPTLVRVDDTATYWLERVRLVGAQGTYYLTTGNNTASILQKDCWQHGVPNYGPGTFGTWTA